MARTIGPHLQRVEEQVGHPGGFSAVSAAAHAYTPSSTGELERIVSLLQAYYPRSTQPECREALARMYGHESWPLLETAALCGEPALFDEFESAQRVQARRAHQAQVAAADLAGVTATHASHAARIEKDLAAAGGLSISRRHDPYWRRQRVERARYENDIAYAQQAIDEIRPSAQDRRIPAADDIGLHLSVRVELLPRALSIWLEHQRPRLDGLASRLAAFRVRQRSQCDLLRFAFAWGELCVSHPIDIPEALQLYPLVLCAKWYGWNACGSTLAPGVSVERPVPVRGGVALPLDPTLEHQVALLRAQPREDVLGLSAPARERQTAAGYALLRPHMVEASAAQPMRLVVSRLAQGEGARRAMH